MQNWKQVRIQFQGEQGSGRSTLLSAVKLALREAGIQVDHSDLDEHSIIVSTNHTQLRSIAIHVRDRRRSA